MAEFSKLVITNKGQALIAKMIAGEGSIEFTKVAASSKEYEESKLQDIDSLAEVRQTTLISKITRTNKVAIEVQTALSNTDLTAGYYIRTLGLYALDPDEGEVLYAVTKETSGNAYMPPYNGITVTGAYITIITTVGNAENVSLEVNPGAVATIGDIQDLEKQIADLQAFVGFTDNEIYGVEVDFRNNKFTRLAGAAGKTPGASFDSIHCFGGRRRCNVTNDGKVVAYYGDGNFSTTGKLTKAVTIPEGEQYAGTYAAGTPVQVMVEQPKFYYKVVPLVTDIVTEGENHGHHIRKARYYVSEEPRTGFKIHPAFVESGRINDFIYLAAFEGSLYDASAGVYILDDAQVADFAADMLSSIANVKPMSGLTQNLTRANTRKISQKRGSGWEQSYAATVAASQMLMLIEYAAFNMQSAIGMGAVSKTDDGASSMTEITGATVNLGNASGAVTNSNGVQIISYRGEENFWGNIWTWVDGMNENNPSTWNNKPENNGQHGKLYVADHGFADDTAASPYVDTGIYPCYGGGYVSAFGYSEAFDWLFIPTEKAGNSALPVGDYFWNQYAGWKVATLGARWSDGASAGAFYWALGDASSSRGRTVGGRLVYVPTKKAA